jgi:AAT family amino acid transporter
MFSAVILFGGSLFALVDQDRVFTLLMAIPGFVVSLVWISICLAQLKLRKSYPKEPSFKLWGFPYITGLTAVSLSVISVVFVFNEQNRVSIIACLVVVAVLIVISIFKFRNVDEQDTNVKEKDVI